MSKWAWCLIKDDDKLAIGWTQVGDYWYYMYSNGAMACNEWLKLNDVWYRVNDKGQMVTGWWRDTDTGKWYYLEEQSNGSKGAMYKSGTFNINDKSYTFNDDGSWQKSILSDKGADFIGIWEGFWDKADYDPLYPSVDKYITIGYGTTMEAMPDAFPNGINSTCTVEQAREWLQDEAQSCAETIKADLDSTNVSLTGPQFDSLISFAYNCGASALLGSTLYKNIVAGVKDANIITSNFQAWSKANGVTISGLYKRRTSEAALFLNGDYTGNN